MDQCDMVLLEEHNNRCHFLRHSCCLNRSTLMALANYLHLLCYQNRYQNRFHFRFHFRFHCSLGMVS